MWQKLDRLDWQCPCGDCQCDPDEGDSWQWDGEYRERADGSATLTIADRDGSRDFDIDFPPGVRLCREVEDAAPDWRDGAPWELFGRIMLYLHDLGSLHDGDADAFTTWMGENRPEVQP